MTLLYMPTEYHDANGVSIPITGGIWVPLAQVLWKWNYNAISSDAGASWVLDGTQFASSPSSASKLTQYPAWSHSGTALNCVPRGW